MTHHGNGAAAALADEVAAIRMDTKSAVGPIVGFISLSAPKRDLIVAALRAYGDMEKMREALTLQEKAEEAHANCDECEGEEVAELCPKCFPFFDEARCARRAALAAQTEGK